VRRQINFGTKLGLPWGISESAYNVRDLSLTYQYRASAYRAWVKAWAWRQPRDCAICNRASVMVDPPAAARNLTRPRRRRARSLRLLRGARLHAGAHAGGSCVAIVPRCASQDDRRRSRTRFCRVRCAALSGPLMQAAELLLQERRPREVMESYPRGDKRPERVARDLHVPAPRYIRSCTPQRPRRSYCRMGATR
jgi:cyclic beta-1,2-glucan synthetase